MANLHVSHSGPRAKLGPKCNYNWPARSYHMCIKAGPRCNTISFISNLISSVFVISGFGCVRFCVRAKEKLIPQEKAKHYIPAAVNFSINIASGRDSTSLLTFGPLHPWANSSMK